MSCYGARIGPRFFPKGIALQSIAGREKINGLTILCHVDDGLESLAMHRILEIVRLQFAEVFDHLVRIGQPSAGSENRAEPLIQRYWV